MEQYQIFKFLQFSHPTEEQVSALKAFEEFVQTTDNRDFLILCGAAGTGKSSMVTALVGYLNDKRKRYVIAAPTGRAARIIGKKAESAASTLHSLLYKPETNQNTAQTTFKLKKVEAEAQTTIFIIDEASMVQSKTHEDRNSLLTTKTSLLIDLITHVKARNPKNKLILLGDRFQLPPVHEEESLALNGPFLERTFNLKGDSYELTEVKRQEDGSYILQNATEIRNAMERGALTAPIAGEAVRSWDGAVSTYLSSLKKNGPNSSVIISVSHKANAALNKLVRDRMFGAAKKILEPGDLLMVIQNWKRGDHALSNGDFVQLVEVDWNVQEQVEGLHFVPVKVRTLFGRDKEVEIEDYALVESIVTPGGQIAPELIKDLMHARIAKNPKLTKSENMNEDDKYLGALRLAYGHAITCHKAQGGEWKQVIVNTFGIPNLKWQYTAVTRASEDLKKF